MTGLQNCCGKEPLPIVMNLLRSGGEPRRIGPLPERLHGSAEAVNWWGGWRAAVSPPQPVVDGAEKRPEMIHHDASLQAASAALVCLLLTVCAAPTTEVRWMKAGTDDATVSRELQDCNAQANAALASERGINQDISATLGGNWQFSGTAPIEQQSMRAQAVGYADKVLNDCMRAKGFTREG